MTDEERLSDYEKSAREPWRWFSAAESLSEAAAHLRRIHEAATSEIRNRPPGVVDVVPQGFHMDQQAHYFEGKCIELYLKGLLVVSGVKVTENRKMAKKMTSHDLRGFCQKAGFNVTAPESETLAKLTEAIKFWGTYPIPTRVESWRPEVAGTRGIPAIWFWTPDDAENYTQMVGRLRARIDAVE